MAIIKNNNANIQRVAEEIKKGGLVAFPTETVYGLGANGLDAIAAAKIFEVKQRPAFNPLILHINSISQIEELASVESDLVYKVVNTFWPGPLTIVLPKKETVPNIITSGNPTVAIRMPAHRVALELIHHAGCPIAAPSANLFGRLSPTTAEHVEEQLGDKINFILDGGNCTIGLESTIIQFEGDDVYLLRPGGLVIEEVEKLIGKSVKVKRKSASPESPGQLKSHYAPSIPIKFIDEIDFSLLKNKKIAGLFLQEKNFDFNFNAVKILSTKGDLREAAVSLFSILHDFEKEQFDLIACEKIPEIGLGKAIMDRLRKAVNHYIDYDFVR